MGKITGREWIYLNPPTTILGIFAYGEDGLGAVGCPPFEYGPTDQIASGRQYLLLLPQGEATLKGDGWV